MAIYIKEDCTNNKTKMKFINEPKNKKNNFFSESSKITYSSYSNTSIEGLLKQYPHAIVSQVEGIHEIITRNSTFYTKECMEKSIPTWTAPYNRPVIMHHNEENGKTIGRIFSVEMVNKSLLSNTPALKFNLLISDKDGIEQIKDKRLLTTSIGVIAYHAKCSICGQDVAEDGFCDHVPGEIYENKLCYLIIEEMEGKEISYVIVPSDKFSQNIIIIEPKDVSTNQPKQITEQNKGDGNMLDSNDINQIENTIKESNKPLKDTMEDLLSAIKDLTTSQKNKNEDDNKNNNKNNSDNNDNNTKQKDNTDKEKEVLEEENIKLKESIKNNYLNMIEHYTKLNKKEYNKERYENRTIDSLKDTLTDLKDSYELKTTESIKKVNDPTSKNKDKVNSVNEAHQDNSDQIEDTESPLQKLKNIFD